MYGKLMSISDEMMWRYYELLTDVQIADIEKMKRESHPMQAKKDLAARIVKDFHSAEAAAKAGEDWAKQFQKDQTPENLDSVQVQFSAIQVQVEGVQPDPGELRGGYGRPADVHFFQQESYPDLSLVIRTDKLLAESGLAESATDGSRKIKQKAVRINGNLIENTKLALPRIPCQLTIKAGRLMKRVDVV